MPRPDAKSIAQLLPLRPQGFLVEYGNPEGADIDLFAIVDRSVSMAWVLGVIDMHVLPTAECRRLITLLDPAVTEPLENGRFVDGDRAVHDEMIRLLREAQPTSEAGTHLLRRSVSELNGAAAWFAEFSSSPNVRAAQGIFMALSYCVSYAEGARRVLNEGLKPKSFAELQGAHPLLTEIRCGLTSAKAGSYPTKEDVERTMALTERAVTGIGPLSSDDGIRLKEHVQCRTP